PTWKSILKLDEKYKGEFESGLDAADKLLPPLQKYEDEYFRLESSQKRLSTLYGGTMSPVSLNEYIAKGGMEGIKQAITTYKQEGVIRKMLTYNLYEQNKKISIGEEWEEMASLSKEEKKEKTIICFNEEGDSGSFKGRALFESFAFRIIEGMLISGYATGIKKGIIQVDTLDSLITLRLKHAIEQCKKAGYLGKELYDSDFSFEITIMTNPSEYTSSNDIDEFDDLSAIAHLPETLCKIPSLIANDILYLEDSIIATILGRVNRPGYYEVSTKTTIRQLIDDFGCGVKNNKEIKAVHIGGLQGGFLTPEMLDLQYNHTVLKDNNIDMGSGSLIVITEEDDIVDFTKEMLSMACNQSCGKCTMCRIGTTLIKNDIEKLIKGEMDNLEFAKMEELCQDMTIGSLCDFGKKATNSLKSGLAHFRKNFENLINKDIHIQQ
ncbi:MAG: SLBB domain-containing protein, partial [Bacteroidales bacterium]|nr:SLBB domain-containing protein [Bacteroidales bacterium]